MKNTILSIAIIAFTCLGTLASRASGENAHDPSDAVHSTPGAEAVPGETLMVDLRVPLMSPIFADTPVAVVDEDPISMRELTDSIIAMHSDTSEGATSIKKSYTNLLDRIIATKLIVKEARNIGFDEMPEFVSQADSFAAKFLVTSLVLEQLESIEPDEGLVDDLYREMSRELLLTTLKFGREEDAAAFEAECRSGCDFDAVAARFIREGRAEGEVGNEQYMKLKDLLPEIAKKAFEMEVDSISPIFSVSDGFVAFHLAGARFYEDPALREEARAKFLEPLQKKAADDYIDGLIEKHATIDEKLLAKTDFDGGEEGFLWSRKEQPVDFEVLRNDDRVLATVHGAEPLTITVSDVAREVEERHFHGLDKAAKKKKLNPEKRRVLRNMLFEKVAVIEAKAQGKDEDPEYLDALDEFAEATLFDTFVKRVIAPDVKIGEEEMRNYYLEHVEEFSSPPMYRMNSIAFDDLGDAENALAKLRKKADFKWVSANSPGQADEKVALFDNKLLSLTALPEDLHRLVEGSRAGDSLLYSTPEGRHHVISIAKVYAPMAQSYEASREDIARIVFDRKIVELVDDWVGKLREAYDTEIFIREAGHQGQS